MEYKDIFSDPQALLDTIKQADKITRKVHGPYVTLERAIILSWWCDRGNCSFCYMSTQKKRIRDKSRARRRFSSILAEAEFLRRIGWRVAVVSGGYGAYTNDEIRKITQQIFEITKESTWLNVGVLSKNELSLFGEEIIGVVGSVETLGKGLREKICPGKPIEPINSMFEAAEELGLKRGMTLILGLGETVDDLSELINYVREKDIDKITVYSLNPHDSTPYSEFPPPASLYQAGVIAALRIEFPGLKIVAGTWIDQLSNVGIVCLAGANGVTKYPLFRMFGNRFGKKVEDEITFAGRKVRGTFTDITRLNGHHKIEGPDYEKIEEVLEKYIQRVKARLSQ
jgi:biotin synthase-like enzyme